MSPRTADPDVATALIEAAARVLAEQGPGALTARRLAQEVGASTTALYTHFGGMPELRRSVRREGFARLASYMSRLPAHPDAMVELAQLGWAYCENAFTNPNLYRAMFMEAPIDPTDAATGWDTFERLVEAVGRGMAQGRLPRCPDARGGAVQIWAMTHGLVAMVLAGFSTPTDAMVVLREMAVNLVVGLGDDREAANRSFAVSEQRIARGAGSVT